MIRWCLDFLVLHVLHVSLLLVLLIVPAQSAASTAHDVINFEGEPAGTIVHRVVSAGGLGPILVEGSNGKFGPGRNAAVIFDSSCPPNGSPKDCSGEDPDLGTPNEAFGGPGRGSAGYSNTRALGRILIVAENLVDKRCNDPRDTNCPDGRVDDPDDEGVSQLNRLTLDFSVIGPVTLHEMAAIDVSFNDEESSVELLGGDGEVLGKSPYAMLRSDNNGVSIVDFGAGGRDGNGVKGVHKMVVTLRGSGGIDEIVFSREGPQLDSETTTDGVQADRVDDPDNLRIRTGEPVNLDPPVPGLSVQKEAKGPDVRSLASGSTADFKIVVTNDGTLDLSNIAVTDPLAPNCDRSFDRLAPGRSTSYTCTLEGLTLGGPNVSACRFVNEVAATAEGGGRSVTASDTSTIELVDLSIEKSPSVDSAGAAFDITVTNNGCDLDRVVVTGELATDCARELGALPAGESRNYTCTMPPESEVCATGTRGNGEVSFCVTATSPMADPSQIVSESGGKGEATGGTQGDSEGGANATGAGSENEEGSGSGGGSTGMLLLLLGLLVVGGLFAWNRMKTG